MADKKIFAGGEFLITDISPEQVFTPEDFTEEHRMIYETTKDFVKRGLLPNLHKIEAMDQDTVVSLLAKAGELGLIATDVPEE